MVGETVERDARERRRKDKTENRGSYKGKEKRKDKEIKGKERR